MATLGLTPPPVYNANPYNIDPGAKDFAGQNYAALTRDLWAQWTTNFLPFENDLIEYASDPGVVDRAQAAASANVQQAFDAQAGATQRRLKGLGLTLDADEQRAADRSTGLARSLADVTAQNVAGAQTRSRQQGVLGNPVPMI
jgi:hypothetical protein